jgi:hypothetical protein
MSSIIFNAFVRVVHVVVCFIACFGYAAFFISNPEMREAQTAFQAPSVALGQVLASSVVAISHFSRWDDS